MVNNKISFTQQVKDEIANIELTEKNHIIALLSGFIKINGNLLLRNGHWVVKIKTENKKTARMIQKHIKSLFNLDTRIIFTEKKRLRVNQNNIIIVIEIIQSAQDLLSKLQIIGEESFDTLPDKDIIKDLECIRAYIAGCFLASGSINSPETTNYHFEIAVDNLDYGKFLIKLLSKFYITAKCIKRRNTYVVYVKRSEMIADILKMIGAHNCLMQFEDVRIRRDQVNYMNKLYNCSIANEMKSIETGNSQLQKIEYIDKMLGINNIDENLRDIAIIRMEHPEASINEIREIYEQTFDKSISKSGVYHRLQKLVEMSDKLKEGK